MNIESKQPFDSVWGKNTPPKRKVFVAMSGGVDSSVAAFLLKRAGYTVHGVYMKEWVPPGIMCESGSDRVMAARVAAHLQIPFTVWDVSKNYEQLVGKPMLKEYHAGHTPNPDVVCNKKIKFGIFLKKALAHGADYIATGHYIKMQNDNAKFSAKGGFMPVRQAGALGGKNVFKLLQAKDFNKDQSYFLWTLTQHQLKHCLFPVGDYTKPEVRKIAKRADLPSWDKKDSQGICFIGKIDFADFLRAYLPKKQGAIATTSGKRIGTHDGVWFYTLGQRHGLTRIMNYESRIMDKKGNAQPYYVVHKDIQKNNLIVAEEAAPELYKKELIATNISWISGDVPKLPLACKARIRYRQALQICHVSSIKQNLKVVFSKPQRAVTSGQSIVFYKGKEILGGGVIE